MINKKLFVVLLSFAVACTAYKVVSRNQQNTTHADRSFSIDHEKNTFLMDGEPFRYVAGSFHYFRTLPSKWRSILKTMRAGGLNAVDLYVYWALHNPSPRVYNWEGIADLEDVIEAAIEAELYVILRPGPYICAEIDNGGHPHWLYTRYPDIVVRTKDMRYLSEVETWYKQLMSKMEKYMYGNGGPILLVQVENEYGAYKKCDRIYKLWLKAETEKYTKGNAVLFTTDRPFDNEIECGAIEGVFATCDFGLQTDQEVDDYWAELRKTQPTGPLVNSEFYTGWLTHWHEQNARRPAGPLANTLRKMLKDEANVNFYMYFGGTNFGFTAGANDWGIGKYMADITSYDYDACLDEAGNPTNKYRVFRDVIQAAFPEAHIPPIPKLRPILQTSPISLTPRKNLLDSLSALQLKTLNFENTPTFEALDQNFGFVLYETTLPKLTRDPSLLKINELRDRAWVFIDGFYAGTLTREHNIDTIPINAGWGDRLQILVENQGRINFQVASDFKGILGDCNLQMYEEPFVTLKNWTVTGIPLDNYKLLEDIAFNINNRVDLNNRGILINGPVIFSGQFNLPSPQTSKEFDMYLDLSNWGKGVIFINGVNLGRYWPLAGPQLTMHIPGELLEQTGNKIVLIEFQRSNPNGQSIRFSPGPRLD